MSVGAVSPVSSTYLQGVQSDQASALKQRKQDFEALSQALSSGDLAGAQSAFLALQQDLKNIRQNESGQPAVQPGQNVQSSVPNALQSLAQALSSGDLAGAQNAFAQFKQDIQNHAQGGHHHHHQSGSAQSNSANPSNATGGAGTSQPASINTTA